MSDKKSDLDNAVEDLGKVASGVLGRLFGPRAVGREQLDEGPTLSPEVDAALVEAGRGVGRLLHAAGSALKEHPVDPVAAVEKAAETARAGEDPPPLEGWSELSGGVKSLAQGLGAVAEGVLDVVAPRKPKAEEAGAGGAEAEAEAPEGSG